MGITFNKRQRKIIRSFLKKFHGKERVDLFEVFKAVAYLIKMGCQWGMLPSYFPAPGTVYYHFRKWSESANVILFLRRLVSARRKRMSNKRRSTIAVFDSQSVRSGYSQSQKGIDGFKRVKGIKRQVLTDSNGYPLLVEVTTANIHDSKGVSTLINDLKVYYPEIAIIKADLGYRGIDGNLNSAVVECVKSNFGTSEFQPLSGRWVVERTHSWLENYRRLCRNYERYVSTACTMTYLASILFMLHYF